MNAQIVNEPFRVSLVGKRGTVDGERWGQVGRQLMDAMWAQVKALGLRTTGINHWVYLPDHELFTGVELRDAAAATGSLEPLHVELTRYLRYVHRGPYTDLPAVWQQLKDHLAQTGQTIVAPSLEIYGHWNEDPNQLTTTILIGLAPSRA